MFYVTQILTPLLNFGVRSKRFGTKDHFISESFSQLDRPTCSMSMEEDEVGTDFDGESGSRMQDDAEDDQDFDDNNSDYAYDEGDDGDDHDENYTFEDEDNEPQYAKTYSGIQFEGNLNEMMKEPAKNALYPVYKQLSEICMVDIQDNFFSALLTIGVKDQILMVSINFPEKEPFFPNAPPRIDLQSKFKAPNEKYNILFNCHPQLLSTQWNFCTDVVQVVRDLVQLAQQYVVDTMDDDYYSGQGVQRLIIKMIRQNLLDITALFPDTAASKLPSFGILRETSSSKDTKGTRPKGVGYSSHTGDGVSKHWDVSAHTAAKLDGIQDLTQKVQQEIKAAASKGTSVDPMIIDSVYFIYSHTISRTVTMEEFFRNLAFYDIVLDSLIPLPPPSAHIVPIQSLMKLYVVITNGRMSGSLEENEKVVVAKLKVLYDRLNESFQGEGGAKSGDGDLVVEGDATTNTGSTSSAATTSAPLEVEGRTRSSAKKRQLAANGTDDTNTTATTTTAGRGFISSLFGTSASVTPSTTTTTTSNAKPSSTATPTSSAKGGMLRVEDIPRVVELEEGFVKHKYASDMSGVGHVNAKWYRRQHMEQGAQLLCFFFA